MDTGFLRIKIKLLRITAKKSKIIILQKEKSWCAHRLVEMDFNDLMAKDKQEFIQAAETVHEVSVDKMMDAIECIFPLDQLPGIRNRLETRRKKFLCGYYDELCAISVSKLLERVESVKDPTPGRVSQLEHIHGKVAELHKLRMSELFEFQLPKAPEGFIGRAGEFNKLLYHINETDHNWSDLPKYLWHGRSGKNHFGFCIRSPLQAV
jgi:hypothetical protein